MTTPKHGPIESPIPPIGHRRGIDVAQFWRLALKELRETLRDRRTIITLVLMPLIVYPLLSIAFQKFLLSGLSARGEVADILIGVESDEAGHAVATMTLQGEALLQKRFDRETPPSAFDVLPRSDLTVVPETAEAQSKVDRTVTVPDVAQAVADGEIDLGVRIRELGELDETYHYGTAIECELIVRPDSQRGRSALQHLQQAFAALNDSYVDHRLKQLGLSDLRPVQSNVMHVDSAGGPVSYALSSLLPLILILMTITGAVYPAIDVTAGERERGTLEALIAAPVPRVGLLLAKYLAVLTVAILTAGANMISMTATVLATGLGEFVFGGMGLTPRVIAEVFGLLILFAMFFSAVLLAVTSFARSFKEAQAYLIPLMLVSIAPGLLSMLPNLKLNQVWAVIPLVNIVLLARDIFERAALPGLTVIVVLSTVFYAMAAITVAARVFGTDAILYGSAGTWTDLLSRPRESRRAPTITSALMCLALMFPAYFLLGHGVLAFTQISKELQLALISLVSLTVFCGIPVVAGLLNRVKLSQAFQLRLAAWPYFVAAVFLGSSMWALAYELVVLTTNVFGSGLLTEERRLLIEKLLEEWSTVSPVLIGIAFALVPAIAEEVCFRGYLLSAFRAHGREWTAILISGLLFGAFHLIVDSTFAFERLLPSTLLGVVLGWVCCKSGSLFPGMLLHACNNGLALILATYFSNDIGVEDTPTDQLPHLQTPWLVAAAIGAAIGITIVWFTSRRQSRRSTKPTTPAAMSSEQELTAASSTEGKL